MTPPPSDSFTQVSPRLVSKKTFCKLLNFLKSESERVDALNASMAALSPGFTVDFYPNVEFESLIIDFLNEQFSMAPQDSMIDYFIYELKFGTKYTPSSLTYGDKDIDLSTPEKLYDFLVESSISTDTTNKKGGEQ